MIYLELYQITKTVFLFQYMYAINHIFYEEKKYIWICKGYEEISFTHNVK